MALWISISTLILYDERMFLKLQNALGIFCWISYCNFIDIWCTYMLWILRVLGFLWRNRLFRVLVHKHRVHGPQSLKKKSMHQSIAMFKNVIRNWVFVTQLYEAFIIISEKLNVELEGWREDRTDFSAKYGLTFGKDLQMMVVHRNHVTNVLHVY